MGGMVNAQERNLEAKQEKERPNPPPDMFMRLPSPGEIKEEDNNKNNDDGDIEDDVPSAS
ncbi:hypothetical protein Gogos_012823 [Gossypium gossypioides]|uniref:Uncharacterized protein n=1 Tax=Gossypium gossypioides TaxID=34282 RepID=A0A7J9BTN3_GOSGO|nr:hypothetical protein [Gossypium gossypioides]